MILKVICRGELGEMKFKKEKEKGTNLRHKHRHALTFS